MYMCVFASKAGEGQSNVIGPRYAMDKLSRGEIPSIMSIRGSGLVQTAVSKTVPSEPAETDVLYEKCNQCGTHLANIKLGSTPSMA